MLAFSFSNVFTVPVLVGSVLRRGGPAPFSPVASDASRGSSLSGTARQMLLFRLTTIVKDWTTTGRQQVHVQVRTTRTGSHPPSQKAAQALCSPCLPAWKAPHVRNRPFLATTVDQSMGVVPRLDLSPNLNHQKLVD